MAEERQNQGQGGRRRYFRRRQRVGKSSETTTKETNARMPGAKETNTRETPSANRGRDGEKPASQERAERTPPMSRRRRRSRTRTSANTGQRVETQRESIVDLDDYTPPTSVFVYSHILRPGSRDNYEFRAEHFSRVGRQLEDYQIDVSVLFTEGGAAPPIKIDPALLDEDMNGDTE